MSAGRFPRAQRAAAIFTEPLALRDGQPYSERYGDIYASRDGALAQARHVFLAGNGLPARWRDRPQFVVLELGFGLGVNFLATWQAWRQDSARPQRLHFVSIELHPLAAADLLRVVPDELRSLAQPLAEQWPPPLAGLHRLSFEAGAVQLTLALGDAAHLLPQLDLGADAIFLDGFAPRRNPAPWQATTLKALARLARDGATVATWCVAGEVREALGAAGFEVQRAPGFGAKKDMLVARFAPRWTVRRHAPRAPYAGERRAIVVGAGLAGCSVAAALASSGWEIEVLEAREAAATAASSLPAGLLHPQITIDDSLLARLSRAGFLRTLQWLHGPPARGAAGRVAGVLQVAADHGEADAMRRALAGLNVPPDYACWVDAAAAVERVGLAPRGGGLWFERGAIVDAGAWCRQLLEVHRRQVTLHSAAAVQSIERHESQWRVAWQEGVAQAPIVIAANAHGAPALLGMHSATLRAVRGRLTLLEADDLQGLCAAITGDGYVAPAGPGRSTVVGASYELELPGRAGFVEDEALVHAGNLARLQRLLDRAPAATPRAMFDALRCVSHDRLPLAGAVPDEAAAPLAAPPGPQLADLPRRPGLYCLTALGSRALTLAPLLAELVTALVEGAPLPIERDLAAAVDPARFLLKKVRRRQRG